MSQADVRALEDQILIMAFRQAVRTVRVRGMFLVFAAGMLVGMLLCGLLLMVLILIKG